MIITREIAMKVRDVVAAGLTNGVGVQEPGKMCVEAAVCYALGLPHGDDPGCVSAPLRRLKIRLNDSRWSSNDARAAGLRRLAVAQLGSLGAINDAEFVKRVAEMTIRKAVPAGLRSAARVNLKHAEALEAAAVRCEREGTREGTRESARHAQQTAAYASASAYAAASAADADAYAYAYAARDTSLATYAEWVVEILIDLKAPGCEFLDLVPQLVKVSD